MPLPLLRVRALSLPVNPPWHFLQALILQSKINYTTIDLTYPTLQGVDLNFEKWTRVEVNSILTGTDLDF